MTSDAKIGLLLGLVFIFVIAFIINGLPGMGKKEDGNKLTTSMVGLQNHQSALGAKERRAQFALEPAPAASEYFQPDESAAGSSDTRFTISLPEALSTGVGSAVSSAAGTETLTGSPGQILATGQSTKQVMARSYVVQDGDSLSSIAKKFYGDDHGNKLAVIKALFEVNHHILNSADQLHVGQELIIPPLTSIIATDSLPSQSIFEKVDSIGRRHLPAQSATASKSGSVYIVREGDSLWEIAAQQLGDGNRYKEIAKLNSDVLGSEDTLDVGMKLKLPAR